MKRLICSVALAMMLAQPTLLGAVSILVYVGNLIAGAAVGKGVEVAIQATLDKFKAKPKDVITRDQAFALAHTLDGIAKERPAYTAKVKEYLAGIRNGHDPKLSDKRDAAETAAKSLQQGLLTLNSQLGAIDFALKIFDGPGESGLRKFSDQKQARIQQIPALESMSQAERDDFEKKMDKNGPVLDAAVNSFNEFLKNRYQPDK
jgi:hypothetical protein